MAKVAIDDVRCGMTLAGDVLGKNGRKLLGAGTVLESGHLRVLRIWGVSAVDVAAGDASEKLDEIMRVVDSYIV